MTEKTDVPYVPQLCELVPNLATAGTHLVRTSIAQRSGALPFSNTDIVVENYEYTIRAAWLGLSQMLLFQHSLGESVRARLHPKIRFSFMR
jgi:hypothetical protein